MCNCPLLPSVRVWVYRNNANNESSNPNSCLLDCKKSEDFGASRAGPYISILDTYLVQHKYNNKYAFVREECKQ